jgi:hypothetical protein
VIKVVFGFCVLAIAAGCSRPLNTAACANHDAGWCGESMHCDQGPGWSRCVPDNVGSEDAGIADLASPPADVASSLDFADNDTRTLPDGPDSQVDVSLGVDAPAGLDGMTCTTPAACCKGCWDGSKCLTGNDVNACGVAGGACKACNQNNPCIADKCTNGVCDADKLTGPACLPSGVCIAGACHCGAPGEPCCATAPACEGNQACQNNRCGSCGSAGAPCCPGNQCAAGSACNGGASCEACGGSGQPCCANSQCNGGLNCGGNARCSACGGMGQSCCTSGNACQANLSCGAGNTCQCGGIGQACCNGSTCADDGNRCNGSEVCRGTCQHENPVICPALDACHDIGVCQPSSGTCTNPNKDGASCNDNDSCTQDDTCQSGTCKGAPLACSSGQRCVGGTCVCNATSCPSGCCSNNQCQLGSGDSACGSAGNACATCTSGQQVCQSHSCSACGGSGQICCAGQSCSGGRICSNGTCLRQVSYDCALDQSRTDAIKHQAGLADAAANYAATGFYRAGVHTSYWYMMFVTFDCRGAPSTTGLQTATFRNYQSSRATTLADNYATVAHVAFNALTDMTYDHWTDAPLDMPGALAPTDVTVEYKAVDVTNSVRADLTAGRATQFRLDLKTAAGGGAASDYIQFDVPVGTNPPTLHLSFLIP